MVPRKKRSLQGVFFCIRKGEYMNVVLEYIIVFIGVLVINYFISKFNRGNLPKNTLTAELLYIKKIYRIDVSNINKDSFYRIVIFIMFYNNLPN